MNLTNQDLQLYSILTIDNYTSNSRKTDYNNS